MLRAVHIASLALTVVLLASCSAKRSPTFTFREFHMGCEARIVISHADAERARAAARAAFDHIAALERVLSDWSAESEVMGVATQSNASHGPFPISPELRRALACALCMANATDGHFEPTIGPLSQLWRRARRSGNAPDQQTLAVARARVGHEHVHLEPSGVVFAQRGMQLDFGGIGKGHAADEALALLRSQGMGAALVELGGDLAVGDAPMGATGWRVRVQATDAIIELPPWSAIATSGDREQAVNDAGARRSHILDRRAGLGLLDAPEITVLVVPRSETATRASIHAHHPIDRCDECGAGAIADALATALSVAPAPQRAALLDRFPDASALLLSPAGSERLKSFPKARDREQQPHPAPES